MLSLSANRIQASASSCRFKHRFTLVEAAHKCRLITKRAEYKAAKKRWGWGDVHSFYLKIKHFAQRLHHGSTTVSTTRCGFQPNFVGLFRETNTRQQPTHAPGRQWAPLQQAARQPPCRAVPCRPAPGRLQDPSRPQPRAGAVPHRHRSQQAKPAQPGLASPSLAEGTPRNVLLTPEVRRLNGHQALQRTEHSAPRYTRAPSPHHEHPPAAAAYNRPCRSRARSASDPAPHVPPYQSDSNVVADVPPYQSEG